MLYHIQENSALGRHAASHHRQTLPWFTMPHNIPEGFCSCVMMMHHILEEFCPWLGCCIISRIILPWVMMLHRIPDRLCPGLRCRIISQKDSTLGYDAASYPRQTLPWVTMPHNIPEGLFSCVMMLHHIPEEFCPWLGCCIISRRILPWVMMLHHIPDRLCLGLWCHIISQKDSSPVLWCCIIFQKNSVLG